MRIIENDAMCLFACSIHTANRLLLSGLIVWKSIPKSHVTRISWLLIVLLSLSSCVMPVQTSKSILQGTYIQEAELQSIERNGATRQQVVQQLGPPTAWFERQRILVYGLVKSGSGAVWLIPAFPAAAGGYVEFVEREAVFFVIDSKGGVMHSGRRPVPRGNTWLEAALEWSEEAGFGVALPRTEYVAESAEPGESLIVIYRPRDNQYVLPFVPPKEELLFNYDFFAEVYLDSVLVAQLRSKTYLSVRVPAGSHALLVSPYADYNPMLEYRSASLDLETQPGKTYFLDMRIEAGKGYIGSMVDEESAEAATKELARLRETW